MAYSKLIEGFHLFQKDYFESDKKSHYKNLVEHGQEPDTLVIACSDSRIDPAILTHSEPGAFFAVRNVAALVPPYNNGGKLRGTSSAIEYAVRHLEVEHIIILGHAGCGGINALATDDYQATSNHNFQFLHDWLDIGAQAKEQVFQKFKCSNDAEKIRVLEQATILVSIENLLSFPWVKDKCDRGELQIHGWYFDMKEGQLLEYDYTKDLFTDIENSAASARTLKDVPSLAAFIKNYAEKCPCTS